VINYHKLIISSYDKLSSLNYLVLFRLLFSGRFLPRTYLMQRLAVCWQVISSFFHFG